jgi:undecaprenyl-diphosphatase
MLDTIIFEKINGLAHLWPALDWLGVFAASYFQYFSVAFLLIFFFWPKNKRVINRLMVASALASALVSRFIFASAIHNFLHRSRPFLVLESASKLIEIKTNGNFAAFPSGHAAFFFALAMAVYFYNRRLGLVFFAGAILIGLARIFVGVHWPSDVLGGAILGIVGAWAVDRVIRKIISLPR